MNNPFGKKDEIYGFQTLHREIGYYISRLEQYERSLKFFDEAINKTPKDKRALIGRSRARAKAIQYEGALEDINRALETDPDDLVVLADKALNTYLCSEFEEGLVQNSRLVPVRQKPDNFSMGVMHCTNAIENCLGERAGRPLRDHFKIIRKLAWKKNYAAQKPFEPKPRLKSRKKHVPQFLKQIQREEMKEPIQPKKMKEKKTACPDSNLEIKDSLHSRKSNDEPIPPFTQPFPFKPLQNYTTNIENYMAEKYLDSMYLDKIFLKKLRNEPGANCPNEKGSKKIKQLAKNCFKTVSYKQELLRTRRPFYFIKYQEARVSGTLKERQKAELELQQYNVKREADTILGKMLDAYEAKKLKDFLDMVEKLKRYCDVKPKKLLPDKDVYMNEIYDKVCKAFYEVYRVNEDHSNFEQNKRIYALLGLPLSRAPSRDSVVAQFKDVFLDYNKEIAEFERRLQNAVSPQEVCWFYHELSRYHLEVKKLDLARVYARKCIQEGRAYKNLQWVLNGTMLLAKCNLQQHNKNDAKNDLLSAIKCAETLKDDDKVNFLKQCLDVVEYVEFDDIFGAKELEKREQRIIQMMASTKMKDEVAHLFRKMSAMPSTRRMTVIPGIMVSKSKMDKSPRSKKMSILPTRRDSRGDSGSELKRPSKKSDAKEGSKGVEFMNLIEFHV
ncbi:outer dynein arm-docking complex subunit 4-like [Rhynchophorus ferrugineus]|uniref:outer dynein arm-docking complex subunit 4-like n=1 Tax=Rhynchophorus ferrugineus TaxID=354439 RepID=UPI003FCDECA3